MIASNLGQIIGRLMLGEPLEFTPAKPEAVLGTPRVVRGRRAQILDLVRERGEVCCADLVKALDITSGNATVMLYTMWRDGQLLRTGGRQKYRYRLP